MKSSSKVLALALVLIASLALVACQSATPVEDVPEIVIPVAAAPVEAPAPAPVVEEAPALQPITGTLSAYGYSVSYSATVGTATVTYPADVIYEEDIAAFAQYIYERHADLLDGVYFEVTTPGTLVITYPEAVTVCMHHTGSRPCDGSLLFPFCQVCANPAVQRAFFGS